MLESHMGELPQQVVEGDEAAVVGDQGRVVSVQPHGVVGPRDQGPGPCAQPDGGQSPGLGPADHVVGDRVVRRSDADDDVPGP